MTGFWAADPTPVPVPDVNSLTKGLPPWAVALVVISVAVILIIVVVAQLVPMLRARGSKKTPDPPTPDLATTSDEARRVADAARILAATLERAEVRLDAALAEMERLREEVGELRQARFELAARLAEATRQMEAARAEVDRLRARLDALGGYRGGPW